MLNRDQKMLHPRIPRPKHRLNHNALWCFIICRYDQFLLGIMKQRFERGGQGIKGNGFFIDKNFTVLSQC